MLKINPAHTSLSHQRAQHGAGRGGFPLRSWYPLIRPKLPQQRNDLCSLSNDERWLAQRDYVVLLI